MSIVPSPPFYDRVADLERVNTDLRAQIRELKVELDREREQRELASKSASHLRELLTPLHNALQVLFGEFNNVGNEVDVRGNPVWDSWKQKLGGKAAEAIDVLMMHGELNADQLRIHLHCARTHVYNVISQLNKAGVIIKNGGRISLKRL